MAGKPACAGRKGEPLRFSGGAARVTFSGPLYVGLAVSAHTDEEQVTATFANVAIHETLVPKGPPVLHSTLETVPIGGGSTDRRVQYVARPASRGRTGTRTARPG